MDTEEIWAVRSDYGYEAVRVERETEHCVFYYRSERDAEPRRGSKRYFMEPRGDRQAMVLLAAQLTSAGAEFARRTRAAGDWYRERKADILAPYLPESK